MKISAGILLSIFLALSARTLAKTLPRGEGLYLFTDKMQLMNVNTMEKHLLLSKTAWIVEFYSSWCGHCQHYAPTWKQFAQEIYGWRNVVRVGAVDCADEKNTPICRSYQVMRYPTIRLFPPGMTSSKFLGVDIHTPTQLAIAEMRRKVADYVEEVRVKYDAVHFPDLGPLNDTAVLPKPRDATKMQIFVFERDGDEDEVGRNVILDASLFAEVEAYRAKATHPLFSKYNVLKTPAILYLDSNGNELKKLTGDAVSLEALLKNLKELFPGLSEQGKGYNEDGELLFDNSITLNRVDDDDEEENEIKASYDKHVYLEDMNSAVRYSLLHEVALHRKITGDTLKALVDFVTMLGSYFPGDEKLKLGLEKLSHKISSKKDSMSSDEWMKLAEPVFSNSHEVKFVSCLGSAPKYRGYPCSLWTLFHALTVSAASEGDEGRHRAVVDGIHGFVKHFFSCRYCSKHFDEMYRETNAEVKNLKSGMMWLWRAHNKVNRRLAGDISEDPKFPKVQFPPPELCPDCFDEAASRWKEDKVFSFLKSYYGKENIKPASSRALAVSKEGVVDRVVHSGAEPSPSASSSRLLFTLADFTICSAMYVLSAAVLIFVYFYFVASKRKRRPLLVQEPLLPRWGKLSK